MANQVGGLIAQSASKKRYDVQDKLIELAGKHPGYTMTQLSWLAAGGELDGSGFCVPEASFKLTLDFFNAKRRGCEISCEIDGPRDKPSRKLVYGKALHNPYNFGGQGVYVRDAVVDGSVVESSNVAEPEVAAVDVESRVADLRKLLE